VTLDTEVEYNSVVQLEQLETPTQACLPYVGRSMGLSYGFHYRHGTVYITVCITLVIRHKPYMGIQVG
jgi:hypothetical protein